MSRLLLLAVTFCLAACSATPEVSGDDAPTTPEALAEMCPGLTAPTPRDAVPLDTITDRLPKASLTEDDAFSRAAQDADGVWRYDATSEPFGGLKTGETGLVAITGCAVVARQTLVIYN